MRWRRNPAPIQALSNHMKTPDQTPHSGDAPAPRENVAEADPSSIESDPDTATTREIGGPKGLEPTRYGDWERKGRCVDF